MVLDLPGFDLIPKYLEEGCNMIPGARLISDNYRQKHDARGTPRFLFPPAGQLSSTPWTLCGADFLESKPKHDLGLEDICQ